MKALQLLLCFAAFAAQAQTFNNAYTIYRKTETAKPRELPGTIKINNTEKLLTYVSWWHAKKEPLYQVSIPEAQITSMQYERTASPRIAEAIFIAWPLIFTKEKKHFLTVQYKTASGEAKFAIFHLDKNNYRELLATLETATGKKVERIEEH